jgi:hypothetical protein
MADACNLEWSFANTKSSTSALAGIVTFEKISSEIIPSSQLPRQLPLYNLSIVSS